MLLRNSRSLRNRSNGRLAAACVSPYLLGRVKSRVARHDQKDVKVRYGERTVEGQNIKETCRRQDVGRRPQVERRAQESSSNGAGRPTSAGGRQAAAVKSSGSRFCHDEKAVVAFARICMHLWGSGSRRQPRGRGVCASDVSG